MNRPLQAVSQAFSRQPVLSRRLLATARRAAIRERLEAADSSSNGVLASSALTDDFRRGHNYLRISLTEKCNLRCTYCMPEEGVPLSPRVDLLTTQEILRLARLFTQQGISKIRLTGGEPTVRPDLLHIVQEISDLPGLHSLGMTTNGIALHRKLPGLVAAGLSNINLSLDTLDPFKFEIMTRRRGHAAVLRSLDAALDLLPPPGQAAIKGTHLSSVKLNVVSIRDVNDYELFDFIALAREKRVDVRFIEMMPFDDNSWNPEKLIPAKELLQRAQAVMSDLRPLDGHKSDTARLWAGHQWAGTLGFISSMTEHFCGGCSRLRLGADGGFKVCLFGPPKLNLRDLLRQGASDAELLQHIGRAVKGKHFAHDGKADPAAIAASQNAPMVKIGARLNRSLHQLHPLQSHHLRHARLSHSKASPTKELTHLDEQGNARMVDVGDKEVTSRSATAVGTLHLSPEAFALLDAARNKKGSPTAVAQLAGIMAAKRTSDLIPLCHPLPLSAVQLHLEPLQGPPRVEVEAVVKTAGRTGVEMEALTAASVACLTLYDMVKSAGQLGLYIEGIRVIRKSGGKSGDWSA